MKQILIISSFLFLIGFSSCKGTKKLTDNGVPGKELSTAAALKRVRAEFLDFDRLNSNADLFISTPQFTGNVNAKIRMVKDSVIWVSASKFGFEAGRALITQDSVFIMERLQRTYIKASIDELSELAGLSLSFKFIEDFLMGNPYLDEVDNEVTYFSPDSFYLTPTLGDLVIQHTMSNQDFRIGKTYIRDDATKMEGNITFEDYQEIQTNQLFSYFRHIFIDSGEEKPLELSIKFNNPEVNIDKEINFSIPDSYTPREF